MPDGQVKLFAAMLHEEKAVIAQPELQRAVFGVIQRDCPRDPDYTELDCGHGRIIRRSLRAAGAGDGIDFPPARQVARSRRDGCDATGALISKEIVHAITSLNQDPASAADLAKLARGQQGTESVHWLRDTAHGEDATTGYAGNGPHAMATPRNLAINLLYLSGATEITRTLQAISHDRNRILDYLPLSDPDLRRLWRSRARSPGPAISSRSMVGR